MGRFDENSILQAKAPKYFDRNDDRIRFEFLSQNNLINDDTETYLEYLVQIVQKYFCVPMAVFNVLDDQFCWCKAQKGLPFVKQPRVKSFSDSTILHKSLYVVEDARADICCRDNTIVVNPPYARFLRWRPAAVRGRFSDWDNFDCRYGSTPLYRSRSYFPSLRRAHGDGTVEGRRIAQPRRYSQVRP
jgi:hypothetical protein